MSATATRPHMTITERRVTQAIFLFCLAAAVAVWLLAIHAPLWLDETGSYWQISGGFSQLWARQGISFVAYPGILWASTKLIGSSEVALRLPSVLAMLGAVWALYKAARELFAPDAAGIAAVVFALNPIIIFAAVDIRPYAFAALAINLSIWMLLRLRRSTSLRDAAAFGLCAGLIVWFQYLFAVILPAFVLIFFVMGGRTGRTVMRQFGAALGAFAIMMLPLIPGVLYLVRTRTSHICELPPDLINLYHSLAPGWIAPAFLVSLIVAAAATSHGSKLGLPRFGWRTAVCLSLACIPLLTLFIVSLSSMPMFAPRHRLIAVPGIALCWTLAVSRLRGRWAGALFSVLILVPTAAQNILKPQPHHHAYSWKDAIAAAEKNALPDHAPVVVCSDFVESDFASLPFASPQQSPYFAPFGYYPLRVPIVPLPMDLTPGAVQFAQAFLRHAALDHMRFLAMGFVYSYPELRWLSEQSKSHFTVRTIGTYDDVKVLEFDPRPSL